MFWGKYLTHTLPLPQPGAQLGTGNFSGKLDEMLIILRWSSIPSDGSSDTLSSPVKLRLSAPLESNTDFNNTLRNTDTSNFYSDWQKNRPGANGHHQTNDDIRGRRIGENHFPSSAG